MTDLRILILRDGRPGHYHQSEGIAACLGAIAKTVVTRVDVKRRKFTPARAIRFLLNRGLFQPRALLALSYRRNLSGISRPDIIVSAGGDTLIANVALAAYFGCMNVFSGSIRGLSPVLFSAIIRNHGEAARENEIIALTPAPVPDGVAPPLGNAPSTLGSARRMALMIGGPSGSHSYSPDEWQALFDFATQTAGKKGWLWTIVTSRRTPQRIADTAVRLAGHTSEISVIDYRTAGPGSGSAAFRSADVVLVTEDSNSMISEAVSALALTVSLVPRHRTLNPKDSEILQFVYDRRWAGRLTIAELSVERLESVLRNVQPPDEPPQQTLARELRRVLPLERYLKPAF